MSRKKVCELLKDFIKKDAEAVRATANAMLAVSIYEDKYHCISCATISCRHCICDYYVNGIDDKYKELDGLIDDEMCACLDAIFSVGRAIGVEIIDNDILLSIKNTLMEIIKIADSMCFDYCDLEV